MADPTGVLAAAILQILNAHAGVRAVCGRTTDCAIAWGDLDLSRDPLPILLVEDVGTGGSFIEGDERVQFAVAAMASGADGDDVTGALLDAAEAALTTPALMAIVPAAAVDPTSQPFARDRVPVDDDPAIPDLVQRTMAPAFLITV